MDELKLTSIFIKQINKYAPLSNEETMGTLIAYQKTKEKALKDRLILHNIRFIIKAANTYRNTGLYKTDLFNIATEGFSKAIDTFDIRRYSHHRLITHAAWQIKAQINTFLRDKANTIRLPANQYLLLQQALKVSKETNSELDPEMKELFNLTQQGSSFSDPISSTEDESLKYEDVIADESASPLDIVEQNSAMGVIQSALNKLPEPQRQVLLLSYGFIGEGINMTLHEVGKELGLSHERVRQIRKQALSSLGKQNPEFKELLGSF